MDTHAAPIRTPDQRLRVFVSSTLKELAAERHAARAAIEELRMAPVMFELGARPHPPRDLYRAYLEQSDVFVGLYGDSYGWVAPDEEVSGLEDEYNLAPPTMPRLIYIKESSSRQPRLSELLNRIRSDDLASFKYFATAEELRDYLVSDLATLLAERFDLGRTPLAPAPEAAPPPTSSTLPVPLTPLIGREAEAAAVAGLLQGDEARLVTILGPGGIGKSRLAIEVAGRLTPSFPGGVVFVRLASVTDASLVTTALAQALGVRDTGDMALLDKVTTALADRRVLLVLDNFEQVIDAAPSIGDLLSRAPDIRVIVTSRSRLHISGEHSFDLLPLAVPSINGAMTPSEALGSASVRLFVERARAMKPDFELDAADVDAVARICAALEGVPLALELAAARIRVLTPQALLDRLDRQLPLLVAGARDLPERQRTLRGTIEWSTALLGEPERSLFAVFGAFAGRTSLDALEHVWQETGDGSDALTLLDALVDSSLVRQGERDGRPYFAMLSTVREFAVEQLEAAGTLEAVRGAHAHFYCTLARRLRPELVGEKQRETVRRLADEHDNLRRAAGELLDRDEADELAGFAWDLYMYWWIGGHLGEVRDWMAGLLDRADITGITRAIALYFTRAITFWQRSDELVVPGLRESSELFTEAGEPRGAALADVSLALALLSAAVPDAAGAHATLDEALRLFRDMDDHWGEAMVLVSIGRVDLLGNDVPGALGRFGDSLALADGERDELGRTIALHHLGWAWVLQGSVERAEQSFTESLTASARLGHVEGIAYGLEGLVATAALHGDIERAGVLAGAAAALRRRTGLFNAPSFSFHELSLERLRAAGAADALTAATARGEALSAEAAVAYAVGGASGGGDG